MNPRKGRRKDTRGIELIWQGIRRHLILPCLLAGLGVLGSHALPRATTDASTTAPNTTLETGLTPAPLSTGLSRFPVREGSSPRPTISKSRKRKKSVILKQPTAQLIANGASTSNADSHLNVANPDSERIVSKDTSFSLGPSGPLALRKPLPGKLRAAAPPPQGGSGSPPNQPTLSSPADGSTGVSNSPTLTVNVSDPNSSNVAVNFYGKVVPSAATGSSFSIVELPDTQYYSASLNGGLPAMFNSQTQWIVNNRVADNIAFVIGLGDLVQNGNNNGNNSEWLNANTAANFLDDPNTTGLPQGIPYSFGVGNHDQGPNGDGSPDDTASYNQYFGTSRYSSKSYYGGHYGTDNDNHYELFSAAGMDFIVINIAYMDPQFNATELNSVLAWANGLLQTYSSRRGIVVSHYLINDGFNATWSGQGQSTYNALKGNPNLFLMLAGHYTPPEGQRADVSNGNRIFTFLSDYQESGSGGDGWLRILTFVPASNQIQVQTYSPYINQSETTSSGKFTVNYDMHGSGNGYSLLASKTGVLSGTSSSFTWPSLSPGSKYEWYATVSNSTGTAVGPLWSFTTTGSSAVSLSPSSLTFSSQAVNTTSAAQVVTLSNTSTSALSISSIVASAQFGQTNNCPISPSTLAVNAICTINVTFTPTATGTQTGSITITDSAVGSPQQVSLTGTGTSGAFSPIRVNSGGPAYTDTQGNVWSADTGFTGGSTDSTTAAITNTTDQTLYKSERWDTCTYSFSVPNGTYTVTLKFAEIYWTSAGQRIFNVAINGTTVLSNFDIVAQAGAANKALDKPFTVTTTTGNISIQFITGTADLPKISAIQIAPVGVAVQVAPTTASLSVNQTQQFTATVTGSSNTAVTWTMSPQVGTLSTSGLYTAPASITATQTVTVTATSAADTTKSASSTVTLTPVTVQVTPATISLGANQQQQFTATVTGSSNTAVTWTMSPQVGTLSTTGLYTAPASITATQTVTVTATSTADATKTAISTITLNRVAVQIAPTTASLSANQTQQFTATVTGTTNTAVTWTMNPQVGTLSTSGLYTAPASITATQTVTVTATSAADTTKAANSTVTLNPPVVAVQVTPATAALTINQQQQFTATVTGTTNTAVTWTMNPQAGTLSTSGLYTAPATITATQTVTVTATSAADTTKTASSTVTLNPPVVTVQVTPAMATLTINQQQQFTATVTGTTNTAVTWTMNPQAGTLSTSGLYTAPAAISATQTVTVKATSAADSTKSASSTVTLNPPPVPAVSLSASSLTFGSPAMTVVQDAANTGRGSTTLVKAFASNVTKNNLMIVAVSSFAGNAFASPAITDTLNSTWSLAVTRNPGTAGTPALASIYYAVVPSTGADTITVHMTGTNNLHMHIYEVSGLVTSSVLDKTGSNFQSGATAATVSTSAATAAANEFVFAYFARDNGSGTWTAGTGYGNTLASPNASAGTDAFSEDKIISATGIQTATATSSGADGLTSLIATFVAGSGGTAVGTTSAAQTLTLNNTGTASLNITNIVPSGDFGETNTCGTFVPVAGSCTISVTFTPTATGTRSGAITITDNAANSPQTVSLTGTGTPASGPVGSLSSTTLNFSNQILNTASTAQSVTLTNSGTAALNITSIVASAQYSQTNTCGASVAIGANCSISVTFTPTATGSQTGTITVTDNATGSPQIINLSGTGVDPSVSFAPTSLTFGNQNLNTASTAQSVTLTNSGSAAVSITSIVASAQYSQTNTCGASVAIGANCSISVTFTPTAAGSQPGTITVTDNATGSPQTINLSGSGVGSGVTFAPTSLAFGNQNVNTASTAQSITLTNSGTIALNITSIVASAQYAQTNTCGASVAAGANCSISVTFTPTATGSQPGTITVTDDASGSPQTVNLSGTGVTPGVTFAPTSLAFGNQNVNVASAAQSLTLTNSGTAALSITSIVASAQYSQTNTCGASVAAGANCSISVTFTPTATGSQPGTITVTDNATGSPQTVNLSGTGVAPGVTFSPTSLTFSSQNVNTTSASQSITLTNSGTAALIITSIVASAQYSQTNTCGASVAIGANCSISITFTPTAAGSQPGTITVTDNATGSPQTVNLSGTGVAPGVTFSPTGLAFGNQNVNTASVAQSVTLTNSGSVVVNITSIVASAAYSQTNTCGASIAIGANCSISVTFTPTATGSQPGTITVTDDASGSPQTVNLSGTGVTPGVNFSPTGLAFGNQNVNVASAAQSLTLTNSGTATLNITSIVASAPYAQTTTCGATVAAGANCSISVTFTPPATGSQPGTITVTDDAATSPQTVNLTGTGVAPGISFSSSSLTFGNQNVNTTSTAQSITLTNSGTAALSITSMVASAQYSQANTCGASVAAGANCSISVTFTPTATGSQTGTITVTDNATGSPQTINLSGSGVTASVAFSPTSLAFGNQNVSTASAAQSITLTNSGTAALNITSIVASAQYSQTNTCGASVAAGANCSISVTFTPTAAGSQPGTITVTDNASGSPQTVSLSGTGIAPGISFSPTSLAFGNQTVNTTSAAQSVTLTNTGTAALNITSIVASAPYAQTNTCSASVAAGANCSISVTFAPTVTGSQPGTVTVTDSATGSPHSISLTGTGAAALVPAVSLSPTSLTFGGSAPIAVVQDTTNTGTGSTTLAVAFPGNVTQNNLIIVGVSSSASNSFASPAITDTRGSVWSLAVTRNPGTTGTPALASIYYAVVPSTGADTVTVHMSAAHNLHMHIYEVSGLLTSSVLDQSGSNFQTGATAATVSTSAATSTANEFVFAYFARNNGSGTWTAGAGYGNTKASPNTSAATDAFSEGKIVSATGTQTATATASASDGLTSIIATFKAGAGGTTVGTTSAAQTVTLTNTGTGSLSITSIVPSGDYGQTNTCGTFVAAAGNCTISVTFTPTAVGTRTGAITFTDNAANSPQSVSLTGTGQ
jgi:hypothetical protein